GLTEHLHGLLEVDDVDAVAGAEDVRLHLGVPTARLVPEVDTGLQQGLHRHVSHTIPRSSSYLVKRGPIPDNAGPPQSNPPSSCPQSHQGEGLGARRGAPRGRPEGAPSRRSAPPWSDDRT